jgi:hypothetical protein
VIYTAKRKNVHRKLKASLSGDDKTTRSSELLGIADCWTGPRHRKSARIVEESLRAAGFFRVVTTKRHSNAFVKPAEPFTGQSMINRPDGPS